MNDHRPKVLITQGIHPAVAQQFDSRLRLSFTDQTQAEALIAAASAADAIIVRTQLPDDFFAQCPRIRAAVRHGVGLDMIPIAHATKAGVAVANIPGANARTVAEFVLMQMLSLAKRQSLVQQQLRAGDWSHARSHADGARELDGATVGIVGYGAIGREVAKAAVLGFGMKALASSRKVPDDDDLVRGVPLDRLLAASDFVVLCCPLTDETRGMIDAAAFERMKRSAFLVNVARGPVADASALVAALTSGRIAGAALDVHHATPLPPEHPLWACPEVLITPHLAGISDTAMKRMGIASLEQALDILEGRRPRHLVNPAVWDHRRQA